jgi:hypothetical protein
MDVGEATWRAPRGGTIDESGLFIAGGDDGSFEVTADLSGRFGTATVDVDGTPPIATLTGLKARSTIRGDVKLSAEVVEAGELVAVTFLVDGEDPRPKRGGWGAGKRRAPHLVEFDERDGADGS